MKKMLKVVAVIAALFVAVSLIGCGDSKECLKIEGDVVKGVKDREKVPSHMVIPDGIVEIGDVAFEGLVAIEKVTLPKSLKKIGIRAFRGCKSLKSVKIEKGVTTIGSYAFESCKMLRTVSLPKGLKSIVMATFDNCPSLKSVAIPDSVTYIGLSAFNNCTSLEKITFEGTTAEWKSISKDNYWNSNVPAKKVTCSDGEVDL